MKFVVISDTHALHEELILPKGDILLHAGDFSTGRREHEAISFLHWFEQQDFKYKIFTAGNHDFFAANNPERFAELIPDSVHFLNDSGLEIEGLNFWGSPVQPDMKGWAFGKRIGEEIKQHWDLIPENTDILLSHTPPKGILDKTRTGSSLGCEELSKRLEKLTLQAHIFGHIHASYGKKKRRGTLFVNASNYHSPSGLSNKAISFQLKTTRSKLQEF